MTPYKPPIEEQLFVLDTIADLSSLPHCVGPLPLTLEDGVTELLRTTMGAPAAIRLTADRNEIAADGEDIAVVRIEVLDSASRPVPTADNLIKFTVSGEGILLGVGNGDPNCQESDKQPMRSLFDGLAQLIVQASRTPGVIIIEASTEDFPGPKLPATRLSIATRKAKMRPAAL